MRGTRIGFLGGGALFIVIGLTSLLWAALDAEARLAGAMTGGSFLIVGVVFLFTARYVAGLDPSAVLRDGVSGTAEVMSTQDTGVTINNLGMVVKLGLRVTVAGREPYPVTIRHVLHGRDAWGSVQPGHILPVRVDPRDPSRVAVDTHAAGPAAGTGGLAAGTGGLADGGGVALVRVTGADIVAAGVATYGQVVSVQPLGVAAGQLTAGLPAEQADDQVVHVVFTFVGPSGAERRKEALIRVPDGKEHVLAPGRPVAVSYLPEAPDTATIDWSRT